MLSRTIVLRKGDHWYALTSRDGDEESILLTLLEYAEQRRFNIRREEVFELIDRLGWRLVFSGEDAYRPENAPSS